MVSATELMMCPPFKSRKIKMEYNWYTANTCWLVDIIFNGVKLIFLLRRPSCQTLVEKGWEDVCPFGVGIAQFTWELKPLEVKVYDWIVKEGLILEAVVVLHGDANAGASGRGVLTIFDIDVSRRGAAAREAARHATGARNSFKHCRSTHSCHLHLQMTDL